MNVKRLEDLIPVDPLEGSNIECYRYLGSHWMDSLQNMELKLSTVSDFNDAFDGRGACTNVLRRELIVKHAKEIVSAQFNYPAHVIDKIVQELDPDDLVRTYSQGFAKAFLERQMSKDWRIACFAKPETSNADALMWSHYANHWKGVRLGYRLLFDLHKEIDFKEMTTPFILDYVRYTDMRPVLDLSEIESFENDPVLIAYGHKVITTKSSEWSYESEWRLLVDTPKATVKYVCDTPVFFWRFHPLLLRTIDIGPDVPDKARQELVDFVSYISPYYRHVTINQVELSTNTYSHEYKCILQGQ